VTHEWFGSLDSSFTDWLFREAAKGATGSDSPSTTQPEPQQPPASTSTAAPLAPSHPTAVSTRDAPPHLSHRRGAGGGAPIYQQAISQALPSTSAQKRTASARSPSPGGPNKSRRMDLPTGPRAMINGGPSAGAGAGGSGRSLLDRVGGPAGPSHRASGGGAFLHPRDDIQSRIDNITNSPVPVPDAGGGGFVPPGLGGVGGGMDPNMIGANHPMILQEMMMNQMAMMAAMGMMNTAGGQFGMPGVDMGMYGGGVPGMGGFPQGQMGGTGMNGRGRGSGRGRGTGGGRGGGRPQQTVHQQQPNPQSKEINVEATKSIPTPPAPIAAPQPTIGTPSTTSGLSTGINLGIAGGVGFNLPERPQSPTLCKFGMKCTNAYCRYSHPSPVATPESGMVLSNEPCEKGKDCKDKDCVKAHVSPAVLNPGTFVRLSASSNTSNMRGFPEHHKPPTVQHPTTTTTPHSTAVPCRFGASCTRPSCPYTHPSPAAAAAASSAPTHHTTIPSSNYFAQQCRFGSGCTRASCPFQHPEGRVLPGTFHRGLDGSSMVSVKTPEHGSIGASMNKSVKFGATKPKDGEKGLQEKLKEVEEKKRAAEAAVKEAEKKGGRKEGQGNTQVPIAA
jgi:nuclear polyadenylated RNA-binding protein NAB2